MADVFSKAKRSEVMSRIRGRGNKDTELALMKILRRHGISGWRRQRPIFGRPDFLFAREKVVVLVDGCFWHGCPRHARMPRSNRSFWMKKLARNRVRDRLVSRTLRKLGWRVVRIWEHELKDGDKCALKIKGALAG